MDLKERIIHGWNISAEGYSSKVVRNDFVSPGRAIWTELILSQAPGEGRMNILDIGTGPGVFAVILNLAGHDTTGIDISPNMLQEAGKNAEKYGASPRFLLMDCEEPEFDDCTFDMIVSRNVVWIMQKPEKAYQNWFRILKPGGKLVVFDGGHDKDNFLTAFDHDNERYIADYKKAFGTEPPVSFPSGKYDEARGWKKELPLTYEKRPEWDVQTAQRTGYHNVVWEDVTKMPICSDEIKFEYKDRIFFRLCADKPMEP